MPSGAMGDDAFPRRVFVSCVCDDFEEPSAPFPGLRTRLQDYLVRADCDVKIQDDLRRAGDVDTLEQLDGYIRRCAAVVHLVGARSGPIASQKAVADYIAAETDFLIMHAGVRATLGDCTNLTYTQWEAYIALHHGVPLFVYVTEQGAVSQPRHLERLRFAGRYDGTTIDTPADLLGQVVGDLHDVVPAFRRSAAQPSLFPS